ncbi:hypothetical protein Rhe02_65030 [Rhizocola hellebori]|uniref:Enterochelin esterase N-terminal domain-containing protein n=1 Tax=Rhizocola hellebori TaxID=1392758 RepID=A0A8J3QFQ9_9ACTN|nr:alpha/beta hydrolase-fold protein [Rhizocola hellebori]GIH08436.1 hypothetical protein Rhe02_65030 [Rhizocola hellebori]
MLIENAPEAGWNDVTFRWQETDPSNESHAVLVRLIGVTDHAYDDGDVRAFLMQRGSGGQWSVRLRLPSTLRSSYQICPIRDAPWDGHPTEERWARILAAGVPDPLNPLLLAAGVTYGNPDAASILELPQAPPQPWHAPRPGVAPGTMTRHEIGEASIVHVYVPAGYEPQGIPLPLVVLFDGLWWMRLNIAATFDNLIADGAAPPMVVAAVESIHGAPRWHALTHPQVYEPFVLDELVPWIEKRWNVSGDPDRTVLAGQSLGGLVTSHLAHSHPDRFGWVIGLSVAAWWGGDDEGGLSGKQILDAFADTEPVPVRFFLDVGSREGDLLASVRLMRDTLRSRGYWMRYREYDGGHDLACWRGGLADGLVAALSGPRVDES